MDFSDMVITETVMPPSAPRRVRPPQRMFSLLCPNCDARFTSSMLAVAYCAIQCSGEAKAVRYGRAKHREYGSVLPPDVSEALHMKVAHALGGGYDQAARRLSATRRAEVWQRDGSRCVTCDAPGVEIDHIDGSSDDLDNLRLLCQPCHSEVTNRHMRPIREPETLRRAAQLRQRVRSVEPLRPCDADDWAVTWRQWARSHAEDADAP